MSNAKLIQNIPNLVNKMQNGFSYTAKQRTEFSTFIQGK